MKLYSLNIRFRYNLLQRVNDKKNTKQRKLCHKKSFITILTNGLNTIKLSHILE